MNEPKKQNDQMQLPSTITIRVSDEHQKAAAIIKHNTVSAVSHALGCTHGEPLIVMIESLLSYAKSFAIRFEHPLSNDGVLGAPWLDAAKGVRALCNGDGGIALRMGRTTDSKDNGVIESLFWAALKVAGFTEADL